MESVGNSQNRHGSRWAYLSKGRKLVDIDQPWLHVMLAAIGEMAGEVMGVIPCVRKGLYRFVCGSTLGSGINLTAATLAYIEI